MKMPSVHEPARHPARLDGLQALRAAAATMVVAFHANLAFGPGNLIGPWDIGKMFAFGHAGVILFFVLSGFIICYAHWHDHANLENLRHYALRRLVRIYPLSIFTVTSVLALAPLSRLVTGDPTFLQVGSERLVASLLLLPLSDQYFPGVLWTLQLEMYFYLAFAVMYLSRSLFYCLCCLWGLFVFAGLAGFVPRQLFGTFYTPVHVYSLFFFAGMGVYFVYTQRERIRSVISPMWLVMFGAAIFVAVAGFEVWHLAPVYFGEARQAGFAMHKAGVNIGYGTAAAFIVAGAAMSRWQSKGPWGRFLLLLGDASFAVYLMHHPVGGLLARLLATQEASHASAIGRFLIIISTGVIVGLAVHVWIERPALSYFRSMMGSRGDKRKLHA